MPESKYFFAHSLTCSELTCAAYASRSVNLEHLGQLQSCLSNVKGLLLHADEFVLALGLVEPIDLGTWFLQGGFGNFGQTGMGLVM